MLLKPTPYAQAVSARWWTLAILAIVNVLNIADRMVIAALAEPIKADLGISDTELGFLTGAAFAILYAIAAVPLALLSDRFGRRPVVAMSIALWSLATAASGLARSFTTMALARVAVGIGEAGSVPASHSIISAIFPPHRRASALGLLHAGSTLGLIIGFAAGAALGARVGWRTTLLIFAIPGLFLAIAVLFLREPPMVKAALSSTKRGTTHASLAMIWEVLRSKGVPLLLLGGAMNYFAVFALSQWSVSFLMRVHATPIEQAGLQFGAVFGIASLVGTLAGGFAGDAAYRRGGVAATLRMTACFALASFACVQTAIWASDISFFMVGIALGAVCQFFAIAPLGAAIQAAVPVNARATGSAVMLASGTILGTSLGPLSVGILSDTLPAVAFGTGLQVALALCMIALLAAASFFWLAASRVRADE